ncbi:MAG: ABC transporter permease [Clostridiales bacterium]|nr:ABC transporter permease [Clostridiales bacterium]
MQSFVMALRSIGANKMRAILTMLGIIIGVMALVVLVSLVNGATDSVTGAMSDLGTSLATVTVSDDKGKPIHLSDLDDWMAQEPDIGLISARTSATVVGKHDADYDSVTVYGTTPSYYDIQGLQLSLGRWLKASDQSNATYVCVLNQAAADELIGYTDCVGEKITLNGVQFTVVGVLDENEDSLTSVLTSGMLMAYIPYSSLIQLTDSVSSDVTTFYLSAAEGSTVDAAAEAMEKILMERFDEDEDAFDVDASNMLEEAMDKVTSTLSLLLGGIAGISLVVGGIGIMNIMMVTVTERTREIGIRKAIGASRGVILTQFLMEAVVLCMIGCSLGIFLSWAILQVVSTVTVSAGITFSLNMGVVGLAVAFCFLIGVVFGLYPANKAAKMKPIDALHYGG